MRIKNEAKSDLSPKERVQREMETLHSNRKVWVEKAEQEFKWMTDRVKDFAEYPSANIASDIARHAASLGAYATKVELHNDQMASLFDILKSLDGKMPVGVVLEARPKYKKRK